jgi:hypothetical protein
MEYVDDVVGICPNQVHVNPWKAIRLVPYRFIGGSL